MTYYIIYKFVTSPDNFDELLQEAHIFVGELKYEGQIAYTEAFTYVRRDQSTVWVGGLATYPISEASVKKIPRLSKIYKRIVNLCAEPPGIEFFDSGDCDDFYCEHDPPAKLFMISGYPNRMCPLMCEECGGYVSRAQLSISESLESDLCSWEYQAFLIESMSTFCGEYESWADSQMFDVNSTINKLGLSVVERLNKELGCFVEYPLTTSGDVPTVCPRCEQQMLKFPDDPWHFSARCTHCKLCYSA